MSEKLNRHKIYRGPGDGPYGTYIKAQDFKWDGEPPRPPKAGEYFLSGAIIQAYKAHTDMNTPYYIAVPVRR